MVTNTGAVPATGVQLVDTVPVNTTYVEDSTYLNTDPVGQPDGGVSPLATGIDISSDDQAPPTPGNGYLSVGGVATGVAMSGDATIANDGTLTIANNAVGSN